jgi:hypothetical protein
MLQVLAYKTHAPSGDILTGPQGSGEGDPDACITDACINCNIDRYRRHFLRAYVREAPLGPSSKAAIKVPVLAAACWVCCAAQRLIGF